ncbi:MAG: heparinase II/III-family protein [Synechococcaceae cyanobacterium]|nr:heparinase II/III-family protein [Synechococcaceae cyanobacterium]
MSRRLRTLWDIGPRRLLRRLRMDLRRQLDRRLPPGLALQLARAADPAPAWQAAPLAQPPCPPPPASGAMALAPPEGPQASAAAPGTSQTPAATAVAAHQGPAAAAPQTPAAEAASETPATPAALLPPALTFRFLAQSRRLPWPPRWNDPRWPRLWQFHLHYFDWAREWLEQALASGRWPEGAVALEPLLDHWIAANPPGRGDGWHPYTLSLRLRNWTWLLRCCPHLATPARLESLWRQLAWLEAHPEHCHGGNHWLENLTALALTALAFQGRRARAIERRALRLLERELERQLLPDGGHEERSASYHLLLLDRLLELACLLEAERGGRLPWLRGAVARMAAWVEAVQLQGGALPRGNDSVAEACPGTAELLAFARGWLAEPAAAEAAAPDSPGRGLHAPAPGAGGVAAPPGPPLPPAAGHALAGEHAAGRSASAGVDPAAAAPGDSRGWPLPASPLRRLLLRAALGQRAAAAADLPARSGARPCTPLAGGSPPAAAAAPAAAASAPPPLLDLPQTGWTLLRPGAGWELLFRCGQACPPHLPAHAHADLCGFDLFRRGEPLLAEAGTSVYGSGPRRRHERSGAAHNVLQLAEPRRRVRWIESVEVWGGFRAGRKARPLARDSAALAPGRLWVAGGHDGFRRCGAEYRRELLLELQDDGSLVLTVSDRLICRRPLLWRSWWHLGPALAACAGLEPLRIRLEGPVAWSGSLPLRPAPSRRDGRVGAAAPDGMPLRHRWHRSWLAEGFGRRRARPSLELAGGLPAGEHALIVQLHLPAAPPPDPCR